MFTQLSLISGFMVGLEFLWDSKVVVIDLGIIRAYVGILPKQ